MNSSVDWLVLVGVWGFGVALAAVYFVLSSGSQKKGRFHVTRDDANAFRFDTDLGVFTIDRLNKLLRQQSTVPGDPVPLEWIERFDFSFETRQPVWEEDAYFPWLSGGYTRTHDLHHWYLISLILLDGQRIPLFEIGEYRPSHRGLEAPDRWWARVRHRYLGPENATIEDRARQTLDALHEAFAASGHPITLTPDWVKKKQQAATDAANTKNDTPPLAT